MQYIGGGGSGCTMAVAVAAADKLSGATLPPSGNTLPLRGLKMAVAEAVAAAVSLSATVGRPIERYLEKKKFSSGSRKYCVSGFSLIHA